MNTSPESEGKRHPFPAYAAHTAAVNQPYYFMNVTNRSGHQGSPEGSIMSEQVQRRWTQLLLWLHEPDGTGATDHMSG